MRIAQVAPLAERIPPVLYGGTERIVSYLTEALVEFGHSVTLFASGDSLTAAKLVPCCGQALRLDPYCQDPLAWHVMELEAVARSARTFDVIHYHVDYLHFPVSARLSAPHVTTLHGRLDLPELPFVYRTFPQMPLVSISQAQRKPLPSANWLATIYHGLPEDWGEDAGPAGELGQHLLFVGRISPEKRVDRAIQIALQSKRDLVIAAKVDHNDQDYFNREVAPLLSDPHIHFIGEIGDNRKRCLLHQASALLFPIDWPEPFGLVMIESMACGTPVIAFRAGSVPEIVEEGVTGFIVDSIEDAVAAVERLRHFDRNRCRAAARERFSARRMAAEYVQVYQRLIRGEGLDSRLRLSVA